MDEATAAVSCERMDAAALSRTWVMQAVQGMQALSEHLLKPMHETEPSELS